MPQQINTHQHVLTWEQFLNDDEPVFRLFHNPAPVDSVFPVHDDHTAFDRSSDNTWLMHVVSGNAHQIAVRSNKLRGVLRERCAGHTSLDMFKLSLCMVELRDQVIGYTLTARELNLPNEAEMRHWAMNVDAIIYFMTPLMHRMTIDRLAKEADVMGCITLHDGIAACLLQSDKWRRNKDDGAWVHEYGFVYMEDQHLGLPPWFDYDGTDLTVCDCRPEGLEGPTWCDGVRASGFGGTTIGRKLVDPGCAHQCVCSLDPEQCQDSGHGHDVCHSSCYDSGDEEEEFDAGIEVLGEAAGSSWASKSGIV